MVQIARPSMPIGAGGHKFSLVWTFASPSAHVGLGTMRNTVTVMNAKGGVGKSTLVMSLAETLSTHFGKRVLVIDSDAQASISHMLMAQHDLEAVQETGRTLVDYLIITVLQASAANWRDFVIGGVSDVDDARTIDLLPSDTHLTLFEREVSRHNQEALLRATAGALLAEARRAYDIVLIDSPPGLSVLTECWLREADFYLSPTKPDYVSIRGLRFLHQFRMRNPEMGFAEYLGVVVNMRDDHAPADAEYERWLREEPEHRCFEHSVSRAAALQAASAFYPRTRSYWAKYPGHTGQVLRSLSSSLLERMSRPAVTASRAARAGF